MSADFPLTQNEPPFKLNFACSEHFPHTQPAFFTDSFAFPAAQNTPPVNGEPLNVGQIPHLHSFAFSGVFGTTIPSLRHLPIRSLEIVSQKLHF